MPPAEASLVEAGPTEARTENSGLSYQGQAAAVRDAPQVEGSAAPHFPSSISQPVPPIGQPTWKPEGR